MPTHYLITNREILPLGKKKKGYRKVNDSEFIRVDGREFAQENLRFGSYTFKNIYDEGQLSILREPDEKTKDDFRNLPSFQWFERLYKQLFQAKARQHDVLVFIHGYNTDLDKALKTLRSLHDLYVGGEGSTIKTIVLFTWSSMGNVLRYRNDAKDAKVSGYAFGRALVK